MYIVKRTSKIKRWKSYFEVHKRWPYLSKLFIHFRFLKKFSQKYHFRTIIVNSSEKKQVNKSTDFSAAFKPEYKTTPKKQKTVENSPYDEAEDEADSFFRASLPEKKRNHDDDEDEEGDFSIFIHQNYISIVCEKT